MLGSFLLPHPWLLAFSTWNSLALVQVSICGETLSQGSRDVNDIKRLPWKCIVKKDPGRAKAGQSSCSSSAAGTNFNQPGAHDKEDLYKSHLLDLEYGPQLRE